MAQVLGVGKSSVSRALDTATNAPATEPKTDAT
ncbi:hypothetical protein [Agreia sp.]